MDEHKGHDTVSAAEERTEKQKQLGETQRKSQQRIQEREKELQDLRQAVQSLMRSAQAAVEDSERIFTELISSIERRRSEVKELIRDQEKAALKEQLEDVCKGELVKISKSVKGGNILLQPTEPKTREEFLQYSCRLTLDPNTAHTNLHLSEGNREYSVGGGVSCNAVQLALLSGSVPQGTV
ncbi:hypothetical protein AGOR_G00230700 [Albula goreensis]|uniref:Uncharacterized protein n=1 Tax=Albula goreensis TaxID=1534307 RepID=A0A8T3CLC1_9TELE|nr:hypothetical protein AGOR_G00230700 [Albula goreensis]